MYIYIYHEVILIACINPSFYPARLRYHRNHDESFINSGDRCCIEFLSVDRAREGLVLTETLQVPDNIFSKSGIIYPYVPLAGDTANL